MKSTDRHYPPDAWVYVEGTYVAVAQCTNDDCLLVGEMPTMRSTKPCLRCGSPVKDVGAARWEAVFDGYRPIFFGLFRAKRFKCRWVPPPPKNTATQ